MNRLNRRQDTVIVSVIMVRHDGTSEALKLDPPASNFSDAINRADASSDTAETVFVCTNFGEVIPTLVRRGLLVFGKTKDQIKQHRIATNWSGLVINPTTGTDCF